MGSAKKIVWIVILLAILVGILSLLAQTPQARGWVDFHGYFGLSLITAILYSGASLLFIRGLSAFTDKLKHAYIFICIGFITFGLAQIELPVLIATGQLDSLWKQSGIIALPFVASLVFLYLGTRNFAKLFNVRDYTTASWFAICVPLAIALLFAFVPHVPNNGDELIYDLSNGLSVWNSFIAGLCVFIFYKIKDIAGVSYTNALAWLILSLMIMSATAAIYLLAITVLGDDELISALTLVPLSVAGAILLRAAYAFNGIVAGTDTLEKAAARNFFGKPLLRPAAHAPNSIDIVTYTANLASDYRAIDTILDGLRQVTATLAPNQPLSSADQQKLMGVYLSLESYLLQKETVRTFTRESLRQHIAQKLQLSLGDNNTFWNMIFSDMTQRTASPR